MAKCAIVCTPDPDRAITVGELLALLITFALPVTLPELVGVKTTLKVVVCPVARSNGGVKPLELKPAPETLIWEMVTLELPVLLSVTVCVPLLPRFRFPKSKLVELAVSCNVAATPVALTAMVVGEAGASLAKDTLAVTPAALAGEKAKLKFALCPGLRAKGRAKPLTVKPLPETAA